ncbi:MAG: heme ABC exporter ATP-binding protein CcmA [Candidatus Hydrothermarchaeaceae archaeon]
MSGAIIELEGLTKRFGSQYALNGVDISIEEGESFALLGPNGAGKTTLVRILSTLTKPTSGTARIAGFDVTKEGREVKRVIGVVSHNTFLYDELTAMENLHFYAGAYGVDPKRVDPLLKKMKLLERANDPVSGFSRGMKQRLSIARSLLHEPQILILDEPSTGLDVQGKRVFYEITDELNSMGKTVLLTTHQMEEAERLCSRAAILHRGKVKTVGKLEDIKGKEGLEEAFLRLTEGGDEE